MQGLKHIFAQQNIVAIALDFFSRKGSGAAEAPDLEGADQGLRLVDSRARLEAARRRATRPEVAPPQVTRLEAAPAP
jgi:hypothetical protein